MLNQTFPNYYLKIWSLSCLSNQKPNALVPSTNSYFPYWSWVLYDYYRDDFAVQKWFCRENKWFCSANKWFCRAKNDFAEQINDFAKQINDPVEHMNNFAEKSKDYAEQVKIRAVKMILQSK